jgi:hypothetical protein
MKRYLAFAGETYESSGGWNEFVGDFDDAQSATDAACEKAKETNALRHWWHVVDSSTKQIIADGFSESPRKPLTLLNT